MGIDESDKRKLDSKNHPLGINRRDFLRAVAFGGSSILLLGNSRCQSFLEDIQYSMIVVDYSKCAGCRTCETVCSAYNNKITVEGEMVNGLGDPSRSMIRVFQFNPDVDISTVCAMCPDSPCIEACTSTPDPDTGKKALYRDEVTHVIRHNPDQCEACASCADACRERRVGIITPNPETNMPEPLCNFCDGDPQCVKHCPQKALSVRIVIRGRRFYGKSPEEIAEALSNCWYNT